MAGALLVANRAARAQVVIIAVTTPFAELDNGPFRARAEAAIAFETVAARQTAFGLEQRLVGGLGSCQVDTQKQLSVSGLSSDFRTYFLKGQKVLKQKYFELLVYDAQTAGCVLYELEQAGISNVRFLRAEYAGMDALQTTLKARAVAAAHQRASAMAGAVGQVVGKAVYISDTGSYGPVYSPAPMPRMAMAEADAASSYKAIDAEFRKLKVEVQVQVKFLLE